MSNTDTTVHYTPVAKILHWLVAGMIVLQFTLAKLADLAPSNLRELALLANHKSVGITILAVAVVRIVWRLRNKPPALPASMPKWQVTASHVSHWSLYALLFAIPLTGWLMSSASAYSVSWFNLFQLPDFVAPNPELKEIFEEIHETLAKLLAVIAIVHIAAAIKHAVIDKDDILSRMISSISVAVFVIVAAFGAAWLGNVGNNSAPTSDAAPASTTGADVIDETPLASSDLPVWQIDYGTSYVRFIGDQAGAEFDGVWETWNANLQFSADDFAASAFDVTVDTASGNTQDTDRDDTLTDPEWFDSINFPEAYFRASEFSASEGGYVATGQLIIKGLASPAQLLFTVAADGDKRVLTGTAQLDRLELGVGTGEWEDTEWVGKDVRVEVRVEATLPH